jgi:hypothetical protein
MAESTIVCSNLAISERLPSGRFTKEQSFSRENNKKKTKSSISDLSICDRPDDTNYVLDHTYAYHFITITVSFQKKTLTSPPSPGRHKLATRSVNKRQEVINSDKN